MSGVEGFRPTARRGEKMSNNYRQGTTDRRGVGDHRQLSLVGTSERLQVESSSCGRKATSTSLHSTSQKFKNFEEVLDIYRSEPLMVVFTAVNCGPCRLMKQELRQVKTMTKGRFRMFAVDTEKFPHVGKRFAVAALPCLLIVQDGKALLRIEGVHKAAEVLAQVQTTITPL